MIFIKTIGIYISDNKLLVCQNDKIIIDEPNVALVNLKTGKIKCYGDKVSKIIDNNNKYKKINIPIETFIHKFVENKFYFNTKLLISSSSKFEKEKIITTLKRKNIRKVYFEDETKLFALGAKVNILGPDATMIININEQNSSVSLFSLNNELKKEKLLYNFKNFDNKPIIKILNDIPTYMAEEIKRKGIVLIGNQNNLGVIAKNLSLELEIFVIVIDNYYKNISKGMSYLLNNTYLLEK